MVHRQSRARALSRVPRELPHSPRVADVLQVLVASENVPADERVAALVRLCEEFPDEYAVRQLATMVPARAPGLFADVPTRWTPTSGLHLTPKTRALTRYSVYRIPARRYLDAMHDLRSERDDRACVLTVPRAQWEALGTIETTPGPRAAVVLPGLDQPGWYAIEETLAGAAKWSIVSVGTFEPRYQIFGRDLVIYGVDFDAKIVTDLAIETPTGRQACGPDGLIRTTIAARTSVILTRGAEETRLRLAPRDGVPDGPQLHVATDRPVYRPGHTVHFKAVRRDRQAGRLAMPSGSAPVVIQVKDPDRRILRREVGSWNAMGTLSGAFVLADEPRLGTYSMEVAVEGEGSGSAGFEVEAYAKPEFLVAAVAQGTPRPGAPMTLHIRAQYLFGAPVTGAEVEWSAQPISRAWAFRDERHSGVQAWAPFEDPYRWYYARVADPSEREGEGDWHDPVTGTGHTGADGTFALSLPIPEDADLVAWEVRATVLDKAQRSAHLETRLEIPTSDLVVTAGTDATVVAPGAPIVVRARLASLVGASVLGRTLELAVFRVRESEGDGSGPVRVYDPVALERATADAAGLVRFELRPRGAGRFGYRARGIDDRDREADAWGDVVVLPAEPRSQSTSGPWTPWTKHPLDLLPERTAYAAGATARILVHTQSIPARALVTVGGASLLDARWVDLVCRDQLVDVALPCEGPNAYVGFTVYDNDQDELHVTVELAIVPVERLVDVVVRLENAELAPRGKARLVVATHQGGKPVAAEVALSIVDQAVLALRADEAPTLSDVFEPFLDRPEGVEVGRSFRDEFRGPSSRGSVGGAIFDSADGEGSSPSPRAAPISRKHFPDTWHWDAHLFTGPDGTASLELDVPDTLTRWRVLARAVAGRDGFGQTITELRVSQPVVLRLVAPRFLVQGDKATVTTVLTSEVAGTFVVSVTAGSTRAPSATVELAPGASAQHEWKIEATEVGSLALAATAVGQAGGDAIEFGIPVHTSATRLDEMSSGAVRPRWTTELVLPKEAAVRDAWIEVHVADGGSLDAIQQALPYLASYPYGCVEQTMSRFLPTLVAMRAAERLKLAVPPGLAEKLPEMVSCGLQRLYHFQHEDGGWGWWERDTTHPRMTAYALYGLLVAREAGVYVEPTVLARGLGALRAMLTTPSALYVQAMAGLDVRADLHEAEPTDDTERAWLVLAGRKDLAAEISGKGPRRVTGEAVQRVALAIRALASVDATDPRIGTLVDWLGLQRRGDIWVSTLDTAHAIYALCEVCRPREPNVITVTVNGSGLPLVGCQLRAPALAGPNTVVVTQARDARIAATAFLRFHVDGAPPNPSSSLTVVRRLSATDSTVAPGDEINVEVGVTAREDAELLLIECPIPAGCEPVVDADAYDSYARLQLRDDRVCAAALSINKGEVFTLRFRLRALQPGAYVMRPATAVGMYHPEVAGASAPTMLRINDR